MTDNNALARAKRLPDKIRPELIDRFWARVFIQGEIDCWEWTGYRAPNGYGRLYLPGVGNVAAHRLSYHLTHGSTDPALVTDHICRNRACVNPQHLRLISNKRNVLLGVGHTANNARKTHCPQGHEYTPANTKIKNGKRYCRMCHRISVKEWVRAKRAK